MANRSDRSAPAGHRFPSARAARGVMLIEALVGVLIFSLGLLALVGLQGSMTRAQTSARSRADAALLAGELVGTMWADLPHLAAYDTAAACVARSRCAEWRAKVARQLPDGEPTVVVDAVSGEVSIRVEWAADGRGAGRHSYVTRTTIRSAS